MPFDVASTPPAEKLKIAVVGAGVSGLSAAWLLSRRHEVILYESGTKLGGHANTIDVPVAGGDIPVDAGFIVFNQANYPNLTALFSHLQVATEESCMSFAASMRGGDVEYSGQTLSSVFTKRASALSPSFLGMLSDIARFHREARKALANGISENISLREFVATRRFGKAFTTDFLEPMASAIWSSPSNSILDYPAASFFKFFQNHGLLQVLNLPIWHTVTGGARSYVEKIAAPLNDAARLATKVTKIDRVNGAVEVTDENGFADQFDHVVVATHADTALSMLARPTDRERDILGAFSYKPNRAVLHFDKRQMPIRRRAWSSWNYLGGEGQASVTYWMNRLQNLTCAEDVFVTLNPHSPIEDHAIVAEFDYAHPMFNVAAGKAQKKLWSLQNDGDRGVWYCGAHFGQGFHEDGLQAGLAVAEAIGGVRRPWTVDQESGRIFLPDGFASLAAG